MRRNLRAFTLVELLVTLLLAGVLLRLALPDMTAILQRERATVALNALIGAVHLARASAITGNRSVVLCPSDSRGANNDCGPRNSWHLGAMVFADSNGNGRRDAGEGLVRRVPGWPEAARVTWRSFRNRSNLRFVGSGVTDWQNGSFTWCPADANPEFAVQVIVNAGGRTRTARDTDGDGIAEDSSGQPLRC